MNIFNIFEEQRNEEIAKGMKAYMKDNFEFLGLKSPVRKELQKEFLKQEAKATEIDKDLVYKLWDNEYREYQYLALDYLIKQKKKLKKEDINFIETLIVRKSWWDSIDIIAGHIVGQLCKNYPELVDDYVINWATSENMWFRRTAILYQIKYKEDTDVDILERVIKCNINDNEFFIRKAIGWALREYSKTNKEWVIQFVENNELSALSKKEASKYLNK